MELGAVYAALGSKVVMVEYNDRILHGSDRDMVRFVQKRAENTFQEIRVKTKVSKMETQRNKIKVTFQDHADQETQETYDRVLISVGRKPNCHNLGLENTAVTLDGNGFIEANHVKQTKDPSIYAIGDIIGGAMLAHKASRDARIAVDTICDQHVTIDPVAIPAVVFTDPELAWCGMTEMEAKEKGIKVDIATFPWSASGRAMSFDRPDGMTKLIIEPGTGRIIGVGVAGSGAGELISEGALAIEMGATASDIADVVHPHPTLSESIMECAERYVRNLE